MKQLVPTLAAMTLAVTLAACSANVPTAPSALPGSVGLPGTQWVFAGTLSSGDRAVVNSLAQVFEFTTQLGNLAQALGDQDNVKAYGLQMDSEYTARRLALQEIAGFQYPSSFSLSPAQNAWRAQVNGVSGSAFDHQFVPVMIASHQAAISELQSRSVDSPILREFVADVQSRMTRHLAIARDIATTL